MTLGRGRGGIRSGKRSAGAMRGRFGTGGGGLNRGSRGGDSEVDQGSPASLVLLGRFSYICENDLVCKVDIDDVPYFNSPLYLENKDEIGKSGDIFGTVRDFSITVKLLENIEADSFEKDEKIFIDSRKLLPISILLPKTPKAKGVKKKKVNGDVRCSWCRRGLRGGLGGGSNLSGGFGYNTGGSSQSGGGGGIGRVGFGRGGFGRGGISRGGFARGNVGRLGSFFNKGLGVGRGCWL